MLRVFEAFAGYGSQSIALRNLGIEYEVVAISEIDKYAIKAYETIHGPTNNLGDISNTQQYKMAGNSIVVNVLEAIFKELFF